MTKEEKAATESANKEINDKINSVKDTAQFAAILNQHGKTFLESQENALAAKYTGNAYNNVDKEYLEGLGLEVRPEGLTSTLVGKLAKDYKDLEAKLKEVAGGAETDQQKADRKLLHETQLSAKDKQINDLTQTNEDLEAKGRHQKAINILSNSLSGVLFNPNLGTNLLAETKDNRIKKVVQNSKEVDGKVIFYMEDGKPYANLSGLPMSAKEVTAEIFKDIILEKTPGGNGSDKDEPHVKGDIVVIPNPKDIKSFSQWNKLFEEAMRAKGLTRADKEYYEIQIATKEHYKFEDLPMD